MVITSERGFQMATPIPEPQRHHIVAETGGLDPLEWAREVRRELIAAGLDPAEEADALDQLVEEIRRPYRT
jgi:hypothetical protein